MAKIEQSIEINAPVKTTYEQLARFEQYPRFMEEVVEVRQMDDNHLHFHAKSGNLDMQWDAQLTQQLENQSIAWRTTNGPKYEGKIELRPLDANKTRVTLTAEFDPKQQLLAEHGDAQQAIKERAERNLTRLKKLVESLAAKPAQPAVEASGSSAAQGERSTVQGASADKQQAGSAWLPTLMQAWDEPFSMIRRMSEDMDQMFERFLGRSNSIYSRLSSNGSGIAKAVATAWLPPVEIAQREDKFVVSAELAGVKREDVHVEIRGSQLTIEGERRQDVPQATQDLKRSERSYGHFYRVISLPPGANADAASASLQDGLLEITVPVSHASAYGRQLEIRSSQ